MALPKLRVPIYDLELPTSKKKIKFRPFLVKEQKLFLIASESKEVDEMIASIKQVISNCVVEPKNFDVSNLPVIDLEYLFIHFRARSMGETVDLEFECNNEVDGKKCGAHNKMSVNLLTAKLVENPEHKQMIELGPDMGVKMRYPNFEVSQKLMKDMKSEADVFDALADCIEYVYDGEQLYYPKDVPHAEWIEWFEQLPSESLQKIREFINTSPRIIGNSQFQCSKCGYTEDIKLEGIQAFFG